MKIIIDSSKKKKWATEKFVSNRMHSQKFDVVAVLTFDQMNSYFPTIMQRNTNFYSHKCDGTILYDGY